MSKSKSNKSIVASAPEEKKTTKLEQVLALLGRPNGASLEELMRATGWQQHSVRGAIAGAIKKRGHSVTSEKVDGVRRYRIGGAA